MNNTKYYQLAIYKRGYDPVINKTLYRSYQRAKYHAEICLKHCDSVVINHLDKNKKMIDFLVITKMDGDL